MRLRRHSQEISVRARLNMFSVLWRVGRVDDCGGLENRWPLTGSEGSNPSPSAKRMFTDTLGTQLSTPQHFLKQCDIYIKNNNLE